MEIQNKLNISIDELWNGCILASIAHAIMVAHYPDFSSEQSWDGINYSVQDYEGMRGTVTFYNEYCVAAFRNENSIRLTEPLKYANAHKYFKGANSEILNLAENEALQYLLDDVDGKATPIITTAMWGDESILYTNDTNEEFLSNGGSLLYRQMMDVESAISAWKEYYDMTEQQIVLLKSIYKRKIEAPMELIKLFRQDIELIGIINQDGLDECHKSFEELNIRWH